MSQKVPLPKALAIIVLSTLLVSGSAVSLIRLTKNRHYSRRTNPDHLIARIVQTGPEREALRSAYLAELLDLSHDCPLSLHDYDLKRGEERLLSSPLIKEAHLKKLRPSTLYVDYTLRHPVASLYDYENTALDREGCLFPIKPYLSPKKLPQIYLGLSPSHDPYHTPLPEEKLELAFHLLDLLSSAQKNASFFLKRIDLSNSDHPSLGRREIVIILENRDETLHLLRLPTKKFASQIANYLGLLEKLRERGGDQVIDLRISSLAFVDPCKK